VNWYIEGKDLSVEATISISEERNINYRNFITKYEHQDFVGILIKYMLGLHLPEVCLHYHCLQLLIHTFFCELFG
jgi:hypothetical protein